MIIIIKISTEEIHSHLRTIANTRFTTTTITDEILRRVKLIT
jgi:hypothetical protein